MRLPLTAWPLLLGSALSLSACTGTSAPAPESRPSSAADIPTMLATGQAPRNQCNEQAAQSLLGQPWGHDTLARALATTGADEARMLRPDSMITREYKVGRVNVTVGTDNRVQRVNCG
ncbi:MAG: I78 family peptidase inhibitor [Pseudomonadota bacterium]|nr:I78 family peptidase inhibitor [Pseudomonadota bacterium]